MENTAHIDLNDTNNTNARFIQVNHVPQIDSHSTAKLYVDHSIGEPSVVRNNKDINFKNNILLNKNSISLNKLKIDDEVITKAYVDQFHNDNDKTRQVLGIDF